ncbi:MAG: RidA family protein [Acidobacteria bacterium]|nr:RidA family protein [Acidobacteriota bacterium]
MSTVEERLTALGLELPPVSRPVANYVPAVRSGNLLFLAGQVPRDADGRLLAGKVGDTMDIDAAYQAARACALQALAVVRDEIGDLDRVVRVVRVLGLVNAVPDFVEQPAVVNGFSDVMVEAFGDAGRHARVAYGAGSLPGGVPVEVESLFEIADRPA